MKGSREQSVGPEVVSINLQDLMVCLCGQTFTKLQVGTPGSSSYPYCLLVFLPQLQKRHRVRLKETLYFTGLILKAKQMHITTIIKVQY